MRIIGIDPSLTATGYGCIESSAGTITLLETGTIEPRRSDLFPHRLEKIHTLLETIIAEHKPTVLVLEKLYGHSRHPMTASLLGHVRGVICLLCARAGLELVEHSVKRIRKSLTGNGNATKQQTRCVVAHILKIDEQKLTLDASDALALALGYTRMSGCLSSV